MRLGTRREKCIERWAITVLHAPTLISVRCPVTYTYTFDDIRHELLGTGFEVLSLEKAHIFCWDIDAYREHRYVKSAEWAEVSERDFAQLEKELGWHTLVRAVKTE